MGVKSMVMRAGSPRMSGMMDVSLKRILVPETTMHRGLITASPWHLEKCRKTNNSAIYSVHTSANFSGVWPVSDTCGIDWKSPCHHHSLVFEMRVFIHRKDVDASPLNIYWPAEEAEAHRGFWHLCALEITGVTLTCKLLFGSSCRISVYWDSRVHAVAPVESGMRNVEICKATTSLLLLSERTGLPQEKEPKNWATAVAPSTGQTENNSPDAMTSPTAWQSSAWYSRCCLSHLIFGISLSGLGKVVKQVVN